MTPEQLETKRSALGFPSQQAFAAFLPTDERTYRRWVRGERSIPPWVPLLMAFMELTPKKSWDKAKKAVDL